MRWFRQKSAPKILSPLEGYNRWASSYQHESNPIKELSDQLVEKFLPALNGLSFLDYGCGTGKYCKLAEEKNASQIIGIDLSPAMIAKAKAQTARTIYHCGDISDLTIQDNGFDVILTALVLGHVEDLEACLHKLLGKLKSGGVLIITDFHPFLTLNQSKRTFFDEASKTRFEVRHHLHLFEEYVRILNGNDVVIETLEEPKFNNVPVVFGLKAIKK